MNVLDANVVIGFLDTNNVNHLRAHALLEAHEGESMAMNEVTITEVLAGPAQVGRTPAEQVWTSIVRMGVKQVRFEGTPLDIAVLRSQTGLPIPDCLVILTAGATTAGNPIFTFDERLAARARDLGYSVVAQ